VRYIAPATADCYACWDGDFSFLAVPVDFLPLATELEERLEEDKAEIAACAVPREDDVTWGDGLVEGAGGWIEEGKVGD
jgi:hypothetical protein